MDWGYAWQESVFGDIGNDKHRLIERIAMQLVEHRKGVLLPEIIHSETVSQRDERRFRIRLQRGQAAQ